MIFVLNFSSLFALPDQTKYDNFIQFIIFLAQFPAKSHIVKLLCHFAS